jgi:hypothetical protein
MLSLLTVGLQPLSFRDHALGARTRLARKFNQKSQIAPEGFLGTGLNQAQVVSCRPLETYRGSEMRAHHFLFLIYTDSCVGEEGHDCGTWRSHRLVAPLRGPIHSFPRS